MSADEEELRRRLYRRDASDRDRAAYAAARPQVAERVVDAPERPKGRRGVLVPVVALAVAAAAALVLAPHAPRGRVLDAPTAVDVQRAAVVASTTERERDAFTAALGRGDLLDLPGWARRHGGGFDRAMEHRGRGSETLPLDVAAGAARVEVLLVVRSRASVGWTLQRDAATGSAVDTRSLVALPGDVARGVLRTTSQNAPTRLVVTAPADVRWDVAVLANG